VGSHGSMLLTIAGTEYGDALLLHRSQRFLYLWIALHFDLVARRNAGGLCHNLLL